MSYWVYFFRGASSKRFKIGIARCPVARLKQLQSVSTEDLQPISAAKVKGLDLSHAQAVESRIHLKFRYLQHRGEVFNSSPTLIKFSRKFPEFALHTCDLCNQPVPEPKPVFEKPKKLSLIRIPKELIFKHKPLFQPRSRGDEYGGDVEHFRVGFSLTKYNKPRRYLPSLG